MPAPTVRIKHGTRSWTFVLADMPARTRGRPGPDWTGYLTPGGLVPPEQMIDDDGGLDGLDSRN